MEIKIRRALPGDLDEIESLYRDLNDYLAEHINYPRWRNEVYPLREHAEEGLEAGNLYVALCGEKIAGTVIFLYEQGEAYRTADWQIDFDVPVIIIHILAVHPDYMRCGAAKALLEYAADLGRSQGIKAIRLDAFEENMPAARLYEECGFSCRGLVDLGLEEIYGLKWYKVFEKVL